MTDEKDLKNRFGYHQPPDAITRDHHATIRSSCYGLATTIIERVPTGREQALALTKLEEVMMWANAGIARQHPITEDPS